MFTFAFSLRCVFASSILMINALVVGRPACRPDQIRALVQFKNEFESRGCNNSDYFHGVMCDNTTGAVTKLKLPSGLLNWNSQTQQLPFSSCIIFVASICLATTSRLLHSLLDSAILAD
ncbi:unnamed protein product [Brassica napus]|uniref:(rape) hypothetical protein n=1 Tax=Brassica napus TaxID=3708 RepID=A0A816JRZ7_BRANA|nr:unnamed protein product [Brassica napus]